jgi:NitT/TauT family transport system substrate-binding protein
MRRHLGLVAAVVGGITLAGMLAPAPAAADPVKISTNTWVGFGPLYLARDKGFFQKRGVEVELITMDNTKEKYDSLVTGKSDMAAGGAGTSVLYITEADQLQYVAGMDDSNGGDGVIAKNEITSLADLKGKTVAVDMNGISGFYLGALLKTVGLKISDVKVVDMPSDKVGKAFINKEVDAAVTWEPWLSKAKATDFGHLLIDSSATPGLLSDALVARKDFVAKHPKEVKAIVEAWSEAVDYLAAHREESIQLMATAMGDWLKDPKVFAETLEGVRYYGAGDNKAFFGTKAKPGPLYQTVKEAIAVWSDLGKVKVKVTPENMMNYDFVNG